MSKKLLSKLLVAAVISSISTNVRAQVPSPTLPKSTPTAVPTVAPSPSVAPAPTPATTPAASNLDRKLLGKAVSVFWQGNRARTESQIVMTVRPKGRNTNPIQINANVKTIAQTGDRFRSDLTVSRVGSPVKFTYSAICDGKNVWLYRPDKREYSQLKFTDFKPQFHSLLVGLSTIFFVSMVESDRQTIVKAIASGLNPFEAIESKELADLKGSTRQVDDKNFYVYAYDRQEDKSNISGFVQPDTAILKRIDFANSIDEGDINIVENIISHKAINSNNNRIFKFIPPKGVKKVKNFSVDLMQLIL
jgi:outer membrane lipoprotein-sorting protein